MNVENNFLVIRHSIREKITDVNDSYRQRLTEEGIELARQLGKTLSKHSDNFTFYHSPVPRCEETANSIKEGIESQNKNVFKVTAFEPLGGFFNRDFKTIADLCHQTGHEKYLQDWYGNKVSPEIVMPCSEAANFMFNEITNTNHENTTKVFITHDWNLFCLQSLFRQSVAEMEIPNYLEGIIISNDKKTFNPFKQAHFINKI